MRIRKLLYLGTCVLVLLRIACALHDFSAATRRFETRVADFPLHSMVIVFELCSCVLVDLTNA